MNQHKYLFLTKNAVRVISCSTFSSLRSGLKTHIIIIIIERLGALYQSDIISHLNCTYVYKCFNFPPQIVSKVRSVFQCWPLFQNESLVLVLRFKPVQLRNQQLRWTVSRLFRHVESQSLASLRPALQVGPYGPQRDVWVQMFLQHDFFSSSSLSALELFRVTAFMDPRTTSLLLTFLWISVWQKWYIFNI